MFFSCKCYSNLSNLTLCHVHIFSRFFVYFFDVFILIILIRSYFFNDKNKIYCMKRVFDRNLRIYLNVNSNILIAIFFIDVS